MKEDKWDFNFKVGIEVEVIEKIESGRYLIKEFMQVMKVIEFDVCSGVIYNQGEWCIEYGIWYMLQSICNIRNMLVVQNNFQNSEGLNLCEYECL